MAVTFTIGRTTTSGQRRARRFYRKLHRVEKKLARVYNGNWALNAQKPGDWDRFSSHLSDARYNLREAVSIVAKGRECH